MDTNFLDVIKSYLFETDFSYGITLEEKDLEGLKDDGNGTYSWQCSKEDRNTSTTLKISLSDDEADVSISSYYSDGYGEETTYEDKDVKAKFIKQNSNIVMIKKQTESCGVTDYYGGGKDSTSNYYTLVIFKAPDNFKFTDGLSNVVEINTLSFTSEEEMEKEVNSKFK